MIPPNMDEFLRKEGMPAAKRPLSDLGLKAVSSGGVRGLAEPSAGRAKNLEQLKTTVELVAGLGVDRMVCPCATSEKFVLDDYKRAQDSLREAGEIVKPYGVVAMLEFMRGSTFVGTLPTSLNLTRETAHPNVKSMFDFYHFWAGLSKFEDLELIRTGEIPHVHFQDVPKIPRELLDNGTRDIPGDGVSPLVQILQALKKKGYIGPISLNLFYPHFHKGDPYELAEFCDREIGFVWQSHNLLPEFPALENVMMPLLVRGAPQAEARAASMERLVEVGLADRASHRAGELSGGEQQRVALARALSGKPSVLLADEPTGNLDFRTGEMIFELLSRLRRLHELTSILVTHNNSFAQRCDRILRLEGGVLVPVAAATEG